jgi:hypothetical protein
VDDSTIANAYSAGIVAGVNDNRITNYRTIDSNATSAADMTSVEIKMSGGMVETAVDLFGPEVGTFQTVADSEVFTFSISPPLPESGQAAGALVAGSLALPMPTISDTSSDNAASAYGDASTVATSNAAGILGAQGNDVITNNVPYIHRI